MILNGSGTLYVAIIGAGPAGYYTAEAFAAKHDNVHVDIIDRLPTPYGLIRAGVAPDHQSIKNVALRYAATNEKDNVHFIGNLELDRDVSIEELQQLYDVVILATGAPKDRALGLEGEQLQGVYGSGAFVGWYNSHPDYRDLNPNLKTPTAVIIGNGNVAIDVARILAKTAQEMAETDLAPYAASEIHTSILKDIYIIGRRGPVEAAFTPKELGELNKLENCIPLFDPALLEAFEENTDLTVVQKKNFAILRDIAANKPEKDKIRLHLSFFQRPLAIEGNQSLTNILLEKTKLMPNGVEGTGHTAELKCGLLVSCIGYKASPIEGIPYDTRSGVYVSSDGHISDNLYCVGWARRGPTGTIGTNRPDGVGIADKILSEITPSGKAGRQGLDALIQTRALHTVSFANWKKIETAEQEATEGNAPRRKFTNIDKMIKIAES
ncbi:FAD-dependent oxidoreductase [Kordiimonas laminariae]|uniref:FAD-dependent oxidoreductase n=1 Tax=Kordiimonas laminariae TaxID=2917717 RepID=UPI001FF3878A|nr:FAD-dependent oxidoreductase [Kordiimonas laminariae]MCK0068573.1 FAD-dependent oxidoreductase [Kordiimonas laminariae]